MVTKRSSGVSRLNRKLREYWLIDYMGIRSRHKRRWRRKDIIFLLERLDMYVSSGLSIDKSLEVIAQGVRHNQEGQVLHAHALILGGSTLSMSLSAVLALPQMVVGLLEHGEQSGNLTQSLTLSRTLLEKQDDIRRKSVSALVYPVVIGVFASLLTIGLVRGVMPQITPMLKSLRVELPILTRVVIFVSDNMVNYGLGILFGTFCIVILASVLYRSVLMFRRMVHEVLVRIPLIGGLVHSYSLSLFLRSCGTLIDSGISADLAYGRASSSVSHIPLAISLNACTGQVSKGISIGTVLKSVSRRTPHISSLLLAGEASGALGRSMIRAADIMDRDMDHRLKRITSLIEPTMMAGMGIVVGAVALSIMMPIYDISRVLQR